MKFFLTLCAAPGAEPARGTAYCKAMMGRYFSLDERGKGIATFIVSESLQRVQNVTTLRKQACRVETVDGPFAEPRKHLGGIYLIDAPDLDAALRCGALRWAAEIPAARYGRVEVRPVMEY